MTLSLKKTNYRALITLLIIRGLYTFLAVKILSGRWYLGFGSYGVAYNWQKDIIALAFLFVELIFANSISSSGAFNKTLLNMLFLLYFIPLNASGALNDMSYKYIVLSNCFCLLVVLAFAIQMKKSSTIIDRRSDESSLFISSISQPKIMNIFLVLCIIFIIYKISYNGFSLNLSFDAENIYSNRDDYLTYSREIGGSLFAYVLAAFRGIISYVTSIYLYLSLRNKNAIGIIVAVLTILSRFSLASSKTVLFFAIIVVYVYFRESKRSLHEMNETIRNAILLLMVLCVIESFFSKFGLLYSYIVRRSMYVPAWLNTMYYDFFSVTNKVHWSQQAFLFQNILPDVFSVSPLDLISQRYFAGTMPSPNTGMFAEAFMHWGVLGIFIYPIIYYFVFNFANKVYGQYGKGISIIVAVQIAIQLCNVPLTRTDCVVSFGFFTVFFWAIGKIKNMKREEKRTKAGI